MDPNGNSSPSEVQRNSRKQILAAALKLFVDPGYFNTNIPDLSRESKCSVGSIYHCFRNKEEIAAALYREGLEQFRAALASAIKGIKGEEQVIKTLIVSFLKFSEDHSELSRYIWLCRHSEFLSGIIKHPTMVGFDDLGRVLTQTLKTGMRDKKLQKLRANVLWSVIFGIPLAYVRDWLDGYNHAPPSQVANQIAETCWRALRA